MTNDYFQKIVDLIQSLFFSVISIALLLIIGLIVLLILAVLFSEFFSKHNKRLFDDALDLFDEKLMVSNNAWSYVVQKLNFIREKKVVKEDYYTQANIYLPYFKLINTYLNLETRLKVSEYITHCISKITNHEEYLSYFKTYELDLLNDGIAYLYKAYKEEGWTDKNSLKYFNKYSNRQKYIHLSFREKYFDELKQNLENKIYLYQQEEINFSNKEEALKYFKDNLDFFELWRIHLLLTEIEIARCVEIQMNNLYDLRNNYQLKDYLKIRNLIIDAASKHYDKKFRNNESIGYSLINDLFILQVNSNPITHIASNIVELIIPKQNFKAFLSSNNTNKTTKLTGYLVHAGGYVNHVEIDFLSMKDESYNMQLVQHITNTVYKLEICMSPSQYESFFKGEDEDVDIYDSFFRYYNQEFVDFSTIKLEIENNLDGPQLEFGPTTATHNIVSLKYSSKLKKKS
tara:strand:+ start:727 stop:2103 length:1377 start_codon:yes stop_codon:yes gene_type:complete